MCAGSDREWFAELMGAGGSPAKGRVVSYANTKDDRLARVRELVWRSGQTDTSRSKDGRGGRTAGDRSQAVQHSRGEEDRGDTRGRRR